MKHRQPLATNRTLADVRKACGGHIPLTWAEVSRFRFNVMSSRLPRSAHLAGRRRPGLAAIHYAPVGLRWGG